jgi:hypothetical protein
VFGRELGYVLKAGSSKLKAESLKMKEEREKSRPLIALI